MRLPGADDADRILDGYGRAQAILADADAPPAGLAEATVDHLASLGLDSSIARVLGDDGALEWRLTIYTDRGTIEHAPEDGETWREMLHRVGFLPPGAPREP